MQKKILKNSHFNYKKLIDAISFNIIGYGLLSFYFNNMSTEDKFVYVKLNDIRDDEFPVAFCVFSIFCIELNIYVTD